MSLERIASFWSRFALERGSMDGATVLENRNLPFLEVNAGYPTRPEHVSGLESWFAARGRPGVLIVPEGSNLEITVSNAQFEPFGSFCTPEWEPRLTPDWSVLPFEIEQVGWNMARDCAQIWGMRHQAFAWVESMANEIARVMQVEPKMAAYLAYQDEQVIGMALALDDEVYLHSADPEVTRTIVKRVAFDLERPVRISVRVEELRRWPSMREYERFSVWVKS